MIYLYSALYIENEQVVMNIFYVDDGERKAFIMIYGY